MNSINTTRLRLRALAFAITTAVLLPAALVHAQTISTVAGNGTNGFNGDGGPATSASLNSAYGVAIDAAGNRYIADTANYRIRKVTPAGIISTFAGTGVDGFSGDGGPATSAQISDVYRIAVHPSGAVYLAEFSNARVRRIALDGTISTVVGTGVRGFSGDGGPATSAQISGAVGIAFDATGNLYFTDYNVYRVRKVDTAGVITTVAGNGFRGFSGDGGPATAATFTELLGLSATAAGVLHVTDYNNARIRRIGTDGIVTTVAGTGTFGSTGDGGLATAATVHSPWDVKSDSLGGFYFTDTNVSRIRYVAPTGIINTFAGTGVGGFSGDGGPATSATIFFPVGLAVGQGQLLIADIGNARIRKITLFSTCAAAGMIGPKLTLCQQICETTQAPSLLTNKIRLYTAIYREAPPCGL